MSQDYGRPQTRPPPAIPDARRSPYLSLGFLLKVPCPGQDLDGHRDKLWVILGNKKQGWRSSLDCPKVVWFSATSRKKQWCLVMGTACQGPEGECTANLGAQQGRARGGAMGARATHCFGSYTGESPDQCSMCSSLRLGFHKFIPCAFINLKKFHRNLFYL